MPIKIVTFITSLVSGFRILFKIMVENTISNSPEATHMITFLFSPWGIPANYRQMQGSGVNYKWVNEEGEAVLIKYHWEPLKHGIKNLTQQAAEDIQAKNVSHTTQDLMRLLRVGITPNGNFVYKS